MRKVVAKKIICNTKHPVSLLHPRKSKNGAMRNRIHLRNGLRKKSLGKRQSKLREIAILAGKVYLKIIILVTKRPCTKLVKLLRVMSFCFCTLHLNQKSRESKFLWFFTRWHLDIPLRCQFSFFFRVWKFIWVQAGQYKTWAADSGGGGSRGRVQGLRAPPWDDLRLSKTTGTLPAKKVWFIGVSYAIA